VTRLPIDPTPARLTIGVVGPADLVEDIMHLSGTLDDGRVDLQLVGVGYHDESEVAREFFRVQADLDVCLFAGPLPYELAQRGGHVSVPSTFIPLSGSALYAALLRGVLQEGCDVAKVSIDSLPRREVLDAYTDLGVSSRGVHVRDYTGPDSLTEFVQFHEQLWRRGKTSAAVTSIRSVAQSLQALGISTLRTVPTRSTIRTALRTATLLGIGSRLEESQIAIAVVEVPDLTGDRYGYGYEELKLRLHRVLLDEALRMDATVLYRDERSYYVIATLGPMLAMTDGFREPPFLDRVRDELGLAVRLGIGLGVTAREADTNAREALGRVGSSADRGFVVGHAGRMPLLAARGRTRRSTPDDDNLKTLRRIVDAMNALRDQNDTRALVVDASTVASALGLTPRAAQRMLHALAHAGFAWPMPPTRTAGPGRPPRPYRLRTEKLLAAAVAESPGAARATRRSPTGIEPL
jgi:hypothetical protein